MIGRVFRSSSLWAVGSRWHGLPYRHAAAASSSNSSNSVPRTPWSQYANDCRLYHRARHVSVYELPLSPGKLFAVWVLTLKNRIAVGAFCSRTYCDRLEQSSNRSHTRTSVIRTATLGRRWRPEDTARRHREGCLLLCRDLGPASTKWLKYT